MTLDVLNIRRAFFVFLLIGTAFAIPGFGQVDQQKLNRLKGTYPWGSIYLTYSSLLNLESIFNDQMRLKAIHQEHKTVTVSRLQSFIQREKAQKRMNESVAFVEIDLNRVEAGFKKITDSGGEITPIAWSKEDVVEIAYLCDRTLNAIKIAENTKQQMDKGNLSIASMWEALTKIQADPYLSAEVVYVLSTGFRFQLAIKSPELTELERQNTVLFASIDKFKTNFDDSFMRYQSAKQTAAEAKERREFMDRASTIDHSWKKGSPKEQ